MNKITLLTSIIFTLIFTPCIAYSAIWEKTEHGVTFSLKQLYPDQVNAFYIGRGFTKEQIRPYAEKCVYTAIFRNDTAIGRIHFLRKNWKITNKDQEKNITENSVWLNLFKSENVKPSALIAFRLSQLPEEQEYDPNGDWNQGMLSIDIPIGTIFEITVNWDIKGSPYKLKLKGVHCAEKPTD
jgi:hypothetical protein